jgi:hypothetical protein
MGINMGLEMMRTTAHRGVSVSHEYQNLKDGCLVSIVMFDEQYSVMTCSTSQQ